MSVEPSSPDPLFDNPLDDVEEIAKREVVRENGLVSSISTYRVKPRAPLFTFEHDTRKGLFEVTWPDGQTEHYRDRPVRHLQVEPDPDTGEMRPVTRHGRPVFIYLSREEREM
jgi:hypothetical protein